MQVETADFAVDDLLRVSVDYGKLTFVLKDLLDRVKGLERERATPAQPEKRVHEEAAPQHIPDTVENPKQQDEPSASSEPAVERSDVAPPDLNPVLERLTALEDQLRALEKRPSRDEADQGRQEISQASEVDVKDPLDDIRRRLEALENRKVPEVSSPEPKAVGTPSLDPEAVESRLRALEANAAAVDDIARRLSTAEKQQNDRVATPIQEPQVRKSNEHEPSDTLARLAEIDSRLAELASAMPAVVAAGPAPDHERLDDVSDALRELSDRVAALTTSSDAANKQMDALADRIAVLEAQLKAILNQPSGSADNGISDAAFNALRGAVEALRDMAEKTKADLGEARGELKEVASAATAAGGAADAAQDTANTVGAQLSDFVRKPDFAQALSQQAAFSARLDKLASDLVDTGTALLRAQEEGKRLSDAVANLNDVKANRSELPRGQGAVTKDVFGATVDEIRRKLNDLGRAAAAEKPSTSDDLRDIAARVSALEQRPMAMATASSGASMDEQLVASLTKAANDAVESGKRNRDQIVEIRATIEHIFHTKADASLVANKAERDYVENALEKLMREVEQVLNSTNAGLIDTLDKSLGILRDMIDGKASKADLARLRLASADDTKAVPEGLTGYKSYRCLGCNRTVDAMRSRPMGSNFSNFMNRLPSSPRQTAPPRSAPGEPRAGYITGSPASN